MQVFILSLGTRGDVELFLTLGRELARRGHRVRFAAAALYEARIRDSGLLAVPLGGGTLEQLQTLLSSLSTVPQRERPRLFFERWVEPQLPLALHQIHRLTAEIDFFICNMKLGLRRAGRIIPGAAVTYDPPDSLEDLRRNREPEHRGRLIEIVALSKALIDPDGLWETDYHFTGFWDEPTSATWEPPADLLRFVQGDPPPVVLAMGSMVTFDTGRLAAVLDEALGRIGARAIVVEGWSRFPSNNESTNRVYVANEIPYGWLFDKASCVIHHGGCGTLAAVLRAGRPSIVLPQLACQENFGKMLLREKLAADILDFETLDAARLADALTRALNDEQIRQSVRAWQKIRAEEKGVAAAADLIERHWQEIQ
ncbi:MAG TPA: glycosyltransferase [Planctomycetaceae bacterium]|jgi:UDP:flavonoid glycosyltransferase YjiC (YdhE family)|nr:glycosyltransferase [Planctomycetaceae bacterium]